jgi:hypothetical protein
MSEQKLRKKYKKSRYSLETLINFSIEKKFKLLKEYTDDNIHIDCIIEGTCATEGCENNFTKNYKRLLTISGPYCKFCQTGKNIFDLSSLNNYIKKNNIELLKDYSDINICRDTEIEGKCNNETCNNNFKKNFRYLIEEGGPYCDDCTGINKFKKMEETNLINFGVKYHTMSEDGKNKVKNSIIEKYGVEHISHNPEIMEKMLTNSYKRKIYTSKKGKEYSCQGYEPHALKILIEDMGLNEDNIIVGVKNVPKINYKDDEGINHIHYPDIFINNLNKIIEIKSTWTFKISNHLFKKQDSAKNLGYLYEIWVISDKGEIIEKHI